MIPTIGGALRAPLTSLLLHLSVCKSAIWLLTFHSTSMVELSTKSHVHYTFCCHIRSNRHHAANTPAAQKVIRRRSGHDISQRPLLPSAFTKRAGPSCLANKRQDNAALYPLSLSNPADDVTNLVSLGPNLLYMLHHHRHVRSKKLHHLRLDPLYSP